MQFIIDFLGNVDASHVHGLIRQYGDWFYLITFIWTALEGETFVIFAALAAQRGYLNIEALFVCAWLGSFCGDQLFFYLGRRYASHIVERFPKLQPKLDKVFVWLEKYAVWFILSYRFMYGVRNVSGIAVGMSHLPWRKFVMLNFVAAFIWATVFCGAGYLFGDAIRHISNHPADDVNHTVRYLMLLMLALFTVLIVVRLTAVRRARRKRD